MPVYPFHRFGAHLRKLREQLRNDDGSRVSQAELARRCGWSRSDQWRYEDGRVTPSTERQIKLAEELGTTVEGLQPPAPTPRSQRRRHPSGAEARS